MRRFFCRRTRRDLITSILLAAFAFSAWIPAGYMPAAAKPFVLQICPDGMGSASLHALHHHSGTHAQFEHCPYASAPAVGPISQIAALPLSPEIALGPIVQIESLPFRFRFDRAHQPRAPPHLA